MTPDRLFFSLPFSLALLSTTAAPSLQEWEAMWFLLGGGQGGLWDCCADGVGPELLMSFRVNNVYFFWRMDECFDRKT